MAHTPVIFLQAAWCLLIFSSKWKYSSSLPWALSHGLLNAVVFEKTANIYHEFICVQGKAKIFYLKFIISLKKVIGTWQMRKLETEID